ncbi:DUF6197 family protein [Nonomuraea gerenzanensis]|uniref:Uncharacterized protein n=1 Tax=Nonomuraea gerenzanensis TaxID=93944 RepID=A0A1M4BL98_9ACTN|nr:hypothetical protein [Nonomuraea gerenzanensis]UBU09999.1 hypothetical protein LCN96_37360 [Nonomuraea gerenzanensis]SAP16292.1 hypothetical protein BN4615_P10955 [Nonomuraea gerenzanensis]
MTTTPQVVLDLAPGAVLARAADIIKANGIARNDYYHPDTDDPRACPVCVLGAIAVACGFHPDAWNHDNADLPFNPAYAAADALIDYLGLDPGPAYDETVGSWSDDNDLVRVVAELRAAAREAASA